MKILDRIIEVHSFLLRSYATEEPLVNDDFFSSLLTDDEDEEEDVVSSEIVSVDEGDEEIHVDEADDDAEVKDEIAPEPESEQVTPVTEQPNGSSEVEAEAPVAKVEPEPEPEEAQAAPAFDQTKFDADIAKYKGELEKQYAISDEDADNILTDPQNVLPKLMANMHLMVLQQVGQLMQTEMPRIVDTTVQQSSTRDRLLAQFQKRYPDLVSKENGQYVTVALKTIKQLHPKISFEDMLEKVGPLVQSLKGESPAPAATVAVAPKATVKPKPHIPSRGTSTATGATKVNRDAMSSFIDDIL